MDSIIQPWPWYVVGPLIGLLVPTLLILGNKQFGISSSLRHLCAACIPSKLEYFRYDWKAEKWKLVFVVGIALGAFIAKNVLTEGQSILIDESLAKDMFAAGLFPTDMFPHNLFSFDGLATLRGFIIIVFGSIMVGFGSRYAGGCTSGHSIMGIAALQWPALVATVFFMIGGFLMSNLILPHILSL